MKSTLESLCTLLTDGTHYTPRNIGEGLPFLTVADMQPAGLNFENCSRISLSDFVEADRQNSAPKRGDVLFSKDGTVGKVHVVNDEGLFAVLSSIAIIRPDPKKLDSNYLAHFLRSPGAISAAERSKTGSALRRIILKDIKRLTLNPPALPEQRRIAAILDQADALRRLRRQSLARLADLGQAIFFEMFGDLDTNARPLKSFGRVVTGATPPSSAEGMFGGIIPFVTPGDLGSGQAPARFVTDAGARKSRLVADGSTLVCCIGATIGKMDQAARRSAFNQQINAIEWGDSVRDDFGYYAVRSLRDIIIFRGKGASTTLPILKKSEFEKLEIKVAALPLQERFAECLGAVRVLEREEIAGLQWSNALFASLQHRAFRGEL